MEGTERDHAMAADGRRVGRLHGKRYAELLSDEETREGLWRAIKAEGIDCHDVWGNGYVEGLRDALREFEGRQHLSRLDTP